MRVDFYILQGEANRELFACRLCEKAYKQKLAIYINAQSSAHAEQIDSLLWTFNDGGFVAHQLANQALNTHEPPPVVIGWAHTPPENYTVLVNLADNVPAFYAQFDRVAEIVNQQDQIKQLGRERFAYYKQQNCELQHHEM